MDEAGIVERLSKLEARVENLEQLTASITELLQNVAVMNNKLDTITSQMDKITNRLTELEKAPADKWGTVVKTTITVVLSAVVGYFVSKFIPE